MNQNHDPLVDDNFDREREAKSLAAEVTRIWEEPGRGFDPEARRERIRFAIHKAFLRRETAAVKLLGERARHALDEAFR